MSSLKAIVDSIRQFLASINLAKTKRRRKSDVGVNRQYLFLLNEETSFRVFFLLNETKRKQQ
jgi:hypothetical protein